MHGRQFLVNSLLVFNCDQSMVFNGFVFCVPYIWKKKGYENNNNFRRDLILPSSLVLTKGKQTYYRFYDDRKNTARKCKFLGHEPRHIQCLKYLRCLQSLNAPEKRLLFRSIYLSMRLRRTSLFVRAPIRRKPIHGCNMQHVTCYVLHDSRFSEALR